MEVKDFSHFYWDNEEQQYTWQEASYVEDGTYITTKDFTTFTLWILPSYGGEPEEYFTTHSFEDAVSEARTIT